MNPLGFSSVMWWSDPLTIASCNCGARLRISASASALNRVLCSPLIASAGTLMFAHSGTLSTVTRPGGGSYSSTVPTGLAITTGSVYYDTLGRPYNGSTGVLLSSALVLTIGTRQVTIQPETGLGQ